MTNLERIMNQDIEKFAGKCADVFCFRHDRLNVIQPYLCGDCEFSGLRNRCNKEELKAYLLAESEV